MNWTFAASKGYTRTFVAVQSATIQGTFTLDTISPVICPNGLNYSNPHGDNLFLASLYWMENVPVGIAVANLTIRGTPFVLKGIGGRERNWNSFAWAQIVARCGTIRTEFGPYTSAGHLNPSSTARRTVAQCR